MSNFSFEPLKLKLATNNIIIPMQNGVADLTNAETSAKIMLAGKELFPIFDEEIGGRNYILNSKFSETVVLPSSNRMDFQFEIPEAGVYSFKCKYVIEELENDFTQIMFFNSSTYNFAVPFDSSNLTGIFSFTMEFTEPYVGKIFHLLTGRNLALSKGNFIRMTDITLVKGTKPMLDWTPAPEEVLQLSTLTFYNCSAAIVGDLVKITSHTPDTTRGWVDVTVNYGNLSNTKRLNWSVEGVEPYKPTGTLLTMNNKGIKL